jgi:hypothetical protein
MTFLQVKDYNCFCVPYLFNNVLTSATYTENPRPKLLFRLHINHKGTNVICVKELLQDRQEFHKHVHYRQSVSESKFQAWNFRIYFQFSFNYMTVWMAQLVQRRATSWTAEESRLDSRQEKKILSSTESRLVLGPIGLAIPLQLKSLCMEVKWQEREAHLMSGSKMRGAALRPLHLVKDDVCS